MDHLSIETVFTTGEISIDLQEPSSSRGRLGASVQALDGPIQFPSNYFLSGGWDVGMSGCLSVHPQTRTR